MRAMQIAVATAALSLWSVAHAQQPIEDHAKADRLFEEAQTLKQQGKAAEACAKYDEALRYNRNAVGTLLNVGKCNEDAGKFASAVKHYSHARDLAREHSLNEHRTAAEQRLTATAPRVPRLAIAFTERLPNMKLVIDDEVFPIDEQTTNDLRLDPGARHVIVSAPGRMPYDTTVTLVEGKPEAIAIPKLGYPVTVKKGRRTLGKVVAFSGAGLAVAGIVVGFIANGRYEDQIGDLDSDKPCKRATPDAMALCSSEGYEATSNARQLGTFGTVVGAVGWVALGVGAYLWLTAPSEQPERSVAVVPSITPEGPGLSAVGRF